MTDRNLNNTEPVTESVTEVSGLSGTFTNRIDEVCHEGLTEI